MLQAAVDRGREIVPDGECGEGERERAVIVWKKAATVAGVVMFLGEDNETLTATVRLFPQAILRCRLERKESIFVKQKIKIIFRIFYF